MRRGSFDFSRCLSEEQIELLILAPEELDRNDRTQLIAHLCICPTCRQVASLLADFYADLFVAELVNRAPEMLPDSEDSEQPFSE